MLKLAIWDRNEEYIGQAYNWEGAFHLIQKTLKMTIHTEKTEEVDTTFTVTLTFYNGQLVRKLFYGDSVTDRERLYDIFKTIKRDFKFEIHKLDDKSMV